ncbi:hypothetical protein F5Y18DRAFT_61968 [Xylariaceae sp. FL1019]|nr:hypothetical protein F5Y18DRAFT_61968 [Xylariaceae sp. FL1019]
MAEYRVEFQPAILQKLYDQAVHKDTAEWAASSFWQVFLQCNFKPEDDYAVVCEFPPDESLRRVDIAVLRYDRQQHTLQKMILVEAKRSNPTATRVKEVEDQAMDAATRALSGPNSPRLVYLITTIGVYFRTWYFTHDSDALISLNTYTETNYTDAGSQLGRGDLEEVFRLMSESHPPPTLGRAPTLPSQRDMLPELLAENASSHAEFPQQAEYPSYSGDVQMGAEFPQQAEYPSYSGDVQMGAEFPQQAGYPSYSGDVQMGDEGEEGERYYGTSEQPSGSTSSQIQMGDQTPGASGGKKWRPVTLHRKPHRFAKDEIIYTNKRGEEVSTAETDWKRRRNTMYGVVWIHETKQSIYYSPKFPPPPQIRQIRIDRLPRLDPSISCRIGLFFYLGS